MDAPGIIVWEWTGAWAAALRSTMPPGVWAICETRSAAACWRELDARPASVVVVELRAGYGGSVLRFLAKLSSRFHQACAIVVGAREMEPYEWLVREAGAVHVAFSTRRLAAVARVIERHLAQAPLAPMPYRGSVWKRLPWRASRKA